MEVKDSLNVEIEERRKVDEALVKSEIRWKILKEKSVTWMKRHPIIVGLIVLLVLIQFVNAYYKMDRIDRKSAAQSEQSMWRQSVK